MRKIKCDQTWSFFVCVLMFWSLLILICLCVHVFQQESEGDVEDQISSDLNSGLRAESAVAQSAAGNQTFCLFLQTNISQPGIKSDVTEVCSLNVYSSHLSIDYINWTWPLVAVCITTIDWMQQRQKGKFSNNKITENKIGNNTWQNNTRLFV